MASNGRLKDGAVWLATPLPEVMAHLSETRTPKGTAHRRGISTL